MSKLEKSQNITSHVSKVSTLERATLQGQNAVTIWLTGLSASGKSTLAFELERRLHDLGHPSYVLDGDNIRHGLCRDLGFSPDNRKENIRRIAEVARLFNEAGLVTITAFISPYRDDRAIARDILRTDRFVETHVAADIAVCEQRDPRGLYRKARAGEIPEFTGVSAPYEAPENPAIHIDTGVLSIEQSLAQLLDTVLPLLRRGHAAGNAQIKSAALIK